MEQKRMDYGSEEGSGDPDSSSLLRKNNAFETYWRSIGGQGIKSGQGVNKGLRRGTVKGKFGDGVRQDEEISFECEEKDLSANLEECKKEPETSVTTKPVIARKAKDIDCNDPLISEIDIFKTPGLDIKETIKGGIIDLIRIFQDSSKSVDTNESDSDDVYPLSIKYNSRVANTNIIVRCIILGILIFSLVPIDFYTFGRTRHTGTRIGYYADRVHEKSLKLNESSIFDFNIINCRIYMLENKKETEKVDLYISANRDTSVETYLKNSGHVVNILSNTKKPACYVEIKIPGNSIIDAMKFNFKGATLNDLLLRDYREDSAWEKPLYIKDFQILIAESYPYVTFKSPHRIDELSVSGSYCACTFKTLMIGSMDYNVNVGSLDILQHSNYTQNKVTVKTDYGTHCVAGNTINPSVSGVCPSDEERRLGIPSILKADKDMCEVTMWVCSNTESCPDTSSEPSSTQGNFNIVQKDGPIQFLINGSLVEAINTYNPFEDSFAVVSQGVLAKNKDEFSSNSKEPRIYLYEVISPGYERLWVHSGLKQYIQARPWLLSLLSISILRPEYIRDYLLHIPDEVCPTREQTSVEQNTLIKEKLTELVFNEHSHLTAIKTNNTYYTFEITGEGEYKQIEIEMLSSNIGILACVIVSCVIGVFSIFMIIILSIRLKAILERQVYESLENSRKFAAAKRGAMKRDDESKNKPLPINSAKKPQKVLVMGMFTTHFEERSMTKEAAEEKLARQNAKVKLTFFKTPFMYINYLRRSRLNSFEQFLNTIEVKASFFPVWKLDSESDWRETSITKDYLFDRYREFCTKFGYTPTTQDSDIQSTLSMFGLEIMMKMDATTAAYTNIRWKVSKEKTKRSEIEVDRDDDSEEERVTSSNSLISFLHSECAHSTSDTHYITVTELEARYDTYCMNSKIDKVNQIKLHESTEMKNFGARLNMNMMIPYVRGISANRIFGDSRGGYSSRLIRKPVSCDMQTNYTGISLVTRSFLLSMLLGDSGIFINLVIVATHLSILVIIPAVILIALIWSLQQVLIINQNIHHVIYDISDVIYGSGYSSWFDHLPGKEVFWVFFSISIAFWISGLIELISFYFTNARDTGKYIVKYTLIKTISMNFFSIMVMVFLAIYSAYFSIILAWCLLGAVISPEKFLPVATAACVFVVFVYGMFSRLNKVYEELEEAIKSAVDSGIRVIMKESFGNQDSKVIRNIEDKDTNVASQVLTKSLNKFLAEHKYSTITKETTKAILKGDIEKLCDVFHQIIGIDIDVSLILVGYLKEDKDLIQKRATNIAERLRLNEDFCNAIIEIMLKKLNPYNTVTNSILSKSGFAAKQLLRIVYPDFPVEVADSIMKVVINHDTGPLEELLESMDVHVYELVLSLATLDKYKINSELNSFASDLLPFPFDKIFEAFYSLTSGHTNESLDTLCKCLGIKEKCIVTAIIAIAKNDSISRQQALLELIDEIGETQQNNDIDDVHDKLKALKSNIIVLHNLVDRPNINIVDYMRREGNKVKSSFLSTFYNACLNAHISDINIVLRRLGLEIKLNPIIELVNLCRKVKTDAYSISQLLNISPEYAEQFGILLQFALCALQQTGDIAGMHSRYRSELDTDDLLSELDLIAKYKIVDKSNEHWRRLKKCIVTKNQNWNKETYIGLVRKILDIAFMNLKFQFETIKYFKSLCVAVVSFVNGFSINSCTTDSQNDDKEGVLAKAIEDLSILFGINNEKYMELILSMFTCNPYIIFKYEGNSHMTIDQLLRGEIENKFDSFRALILSFIFECNLETTTKIAQEWIKLYNTSMIGEQCLNEFAENKESIYPAFFKLLYSTTYEECRVIQGIDGTKHRMLNIENLNSVLRSDQNNDAFKLLLGVIKIIKFDRNYIDKLVVDKKTVKFVSALINVHYCNNYKSKTNVLLAFAELQKSQNYSYLNEFQLNCEHNKNLVLPLLILVSVYGLSEDFDKSNMSQYEMRKQIIDIIDEINKNLDNSHCIERPPLTRSGIVTSIFQSGYYRDLAEALFDGCFSTCILKNACCQNQKRTANCLLGVIMGLCLNRSILIRSNLFSLLNNQVNKQWLNAIISLVTKNVDSEHEIKALCKQANLNGSLVINLIKLKSLNYRNELYTTVFSIAKDHSSVANIIAALVCMLKEDFSSLSVLTKMLNVNTTLLKALLELSKGNFDYDDKRSISTISNSLGIKHHGSFKMLCLLFCEPKTSSEVSKVSHILLHGNEVYDNVVYLTMIGKCVANHSCRIDQLNPDKAISSVSNKLADAIKFSSDGLYNLVHDLIHDCWTIIRSKGKPDSLKLSSTLGQNVRIDDIIEILKSIHTDFIKQKKEANAKFNQRYSSKCHHLIRTSKQKNASNNESSLVDDADIGENETICTFDITGSSFPIKQSYYTCKDCNVIVCQGCSDACHSYHDLGAETIDYSICMCRFGHEGTPCMKEVANDKIQQDSDTDQDLLQTSSIKVAIPSKLSTKKTTTSSKNINDFDPEDKSKGFDDQREIKGKDDLFRILINKNCNNERVDSDSLMIHDDLLGRKVHVLEYLVLLAYGCPQPNLLKLLSADNGEEFKDLNDLSPVYPPDHNYNYDYMVAVTSALQGDLGLFSMYNGGLLKQYELLANEGTDPKDQAIKAYLILKSDKAQYDACSKTPTQSKLSMRGILQMYKVKARNSQMEFKKRSMASFKDQMHSQFRNKDTYKQNAHFGKRECYEKLMRSLFEHSSVEASWLHRIFCAGETGVLEELGYSSDDSKTDGICQFLETDLRMSSNALDWLRGILQASNDDIEGIKFISSNGSMKCNLYNAICSDQKGSMEPFFKEIDDLVPAQLMNRVESLMNGNVKELYYFISSQSSQKDGKSIVADEDKLCRRLEAIKNLILNQTTDGEELKNSLKEIGINSNIQRYLECLRGILDHDPDSIIQIFHDEDLFRSHCRSSSQSNNAEIEILETIIKLIYNDDFRRAQQPLIDEENMARRDQMLQLLQRIALVDGICRIHEEEQFVNNLGPDFLQMTRSVVKACSMDNISLAKLIDFASNQSSDIALTVSILASSHKQIREYMKEHSKEDNANNKEVFVKGCNEILNLIQAQTGIKIDLPNSDYSNRIKYIFFALMTEQQNLDLLIHEIKLFGKNGSKLREAYQLLQGLIKHSELNKIEEYVSKACEAMKNGKHSIKENLVNIKPADIGYESTPLEETVNGFKETAFAIPESETFKTLSDLFVDGRSKIKTPILVKILLESSYLKKESADQLIEIIILMFSENPMIGRILRTIQQCANNNRKALFKDYMKITGVFLVAYIHEQKMKLEENYDPQHKENIDKLMNMFEQPSFVNGFKAIMEISIFLLTKGRDSVRLQNFHTVCIEFCKSVQEYQEMFPKDLEKEGNLITDPNNQACFIMFLTGIVTGEFNLAEGLARKFGDFNGTQVKKLINILKRFKNEIFKNRELNDTSVSNTEEKNDIDIVQASLYRAKEALSRKTGVSVKRIDQVAGIANEVVTNGPTEAVMGMIFNHFDKDNSGYIDYYEFNELCKFLGLNISKERCLKLFSQADENGNNQIDKHEFSKAMELIKKEIYTHTLEKLGITVEDLIWIGVLALIFLLMLFVFIFLGIRTFSKITNFNSVVNSIMPVVAGVIASSRNIDIKSYVDRAKDYITGLLSKIKDF